MGPKATFDNPPFTLSKCRQDTHKKSFLHVLEWILIS